MALFSSSFTKYGYMVSTSRSLQRGLTIRSGPMSADCTIAGETVLTLIPNGPRKSAKAPDRPRTADLDVPYDRQRAGTGLATMLAMLMMTPRSSLTRGAKGPSSGYCELMASATTASTTKVPYVLTCKQVLNFYAPQLDIGRKVLTAMLSVNLCDQGLPGAIAAQCTTPHSPPLGNTESA